MSSTSYPTVQTAPNKNSTLHKQSQQLLSPSGALPTEGSGSSKEPGSQSPEKVFSDLSKGGSQSTTTPPCGPCGRKRRVHKPNANLKAEAVFSTPEHRDTAGSGNDDVSSALFADRKEPNDACHCNCTSSRGHTSAPPSFEDQALRAERRFENEKKGNPWKWSQERRNWYQGDPGTTNIWYPEEWL
ncbi:hypothetical protein MKZ38_009893 [Zalerion maritima]|uniref:Uncharacterized protein n=1 Tax=Zalerion maritima TaxID=339359 RepID=A0AAD5WLZ3_9PEZI|nr:hypothetical protein MKZ38_009893 [Zalerion maritima]